MDIQIERRFKALANKSGTETLSSKIVEATLKRI